MKNRSLYMAGLFLILILFFSSCSKTGQCVISYDCDTGTTEYSGQTTAYDLKETDCEELAEDFKQEGECEVMKDWIPE